MKHFEANSFLVLSLPHNLRALSNSLCLRTPSLARFVSLDGPLALADSGSAGDGVFAEVGAVVALGGGVDDGGVGPGTG